MPITNDGLVQFEEEIKKEVDSVARQLGSLAESMQPRSLTKFKPWDPTERIHWVQFFQHAFPCLLPTLTAADREVLRSHIFNMVDDKETNQQIREECLKMEYLPRKLFASALGLVYKLMKAGEFESTGIELNGNHRSRSQSVAARAKSRTRRRAESPPTSSRTGRDDGKRGRSPPDDSRHTKRPRSESEGRGRQPGPRQAPVPQSTNEPGARQPRRVLKALSDSGP
ncbi:hypothetical protein HDU97_006282, partial [Phlyctochytrium planicorne]